MGEIYPVKDNTSDLQAASFFIDAQNEIYEDVFEFWIPGVLINGVGILGLLGNVLSIVVLNRLAVNSSISLLLVSLSVCDSLLIISSILMFGLPGIINHMFRSGSFSSVDYSVYMQSVYPVILPVIYPLGLVFQTVSIYLTVCVSVERFIAVCRPLHAKHLCTIHRTRLAVLVTVLLATGYNLPRFWEISYAYRDSSLFADIVQTELRQNTYYVQVYVTWMYVIFMYIFPLVMLTMLNCLIYKEVRRARNLREELSRNRRKELGLTVMLLAVVSAFFVFNLLALLVNILEHFGILIHALTQMNNFLVTLNSSVNFVIYCTFGQKFRSNFGKIFSKFGCFKNPWTNIEVIEMTSHLRTSSKLRSRSKSTNITLNFSFRRSPAGTQISAP